MAKIVFEYRGERFVEDSKSVRWHVNDVGDIVHGYYEETWYEGSDECPDEEVSKLLPIYEQIIDEYGHKKYRNIKVI